MKHRIAIIGAGFMGGVHARSIFKHSGAELAAICDERSDVSELLAKEYNVPAYISCTRLLDTEKPDAIFVCLPPFAHRGEVAEASTRGIHVFIEKPIGLTCSQAYDMVKVTAGIKTQVGYHYRFGGAVRELKRLIDNGMAGRPVLFNASYECNSLHGSWWREKEKCGSQILEQAIHLYDMGMYLMDKPISVYGVMDNLCHTEVERYTVEDVSAAVIRFESGAIGSITATNCAVPGHWKNPFTTVFEHITAKFSDPNNAVFINTSTDKPEERVISYDKDLYYEEVSSFINLLDGECVSACPIAEGYESLRLVEETVCSAKTGEVRNLGGI